jgi:hypothetical protein
MPTNHVELNTPQTNPSADALSTLQQCRTVYIGDLPWAQGGLTFIINILQVFAIVLCHAGWI